MSTQTIYLEITFSDINPPSNSLYIALQYVGDLPPITHPNFPGTIYDINAAYNIGDNCGITGNSILNPVDTDKITFISTDVESSIIIEGVSLSDVTNIGDLEISFLDLSYSDATGTGTGYVEVNSQDYDVTVNYSFTTPISPCCFSEGTKILCYTQLENSLISILKEEYRLVQHLKIGDLVKSYLVPMKYTDIEKLVNC